MPVQTYQARDASDVARGLRDLINYAAAIEPEKIERIETPELGTEKLLSLLAFLADQSHGSVLVAREAGKLMGFAAIFVRKTEENRYTVLKPAVTGVVQELWVDPSARGTGYGAELMRHAVSLFREAGCDNYELRALTSNTPACAFYERKAGMRPVVTVYSSAISRE